MTLSEKKTPESAAVFVESPGGYTTVQDLGRYGFQHMGVPVSGALDLFSARAANLLLGNPEEAALLEITVMGPTLEIRKEMDIALTGARMGFTVNGQPAPQWASVRVGPGDTVGISMIRTGCRAYLAFTGGIDVPVIMGSRSTYAGGGIGGLDGRPLKQGDCLKTGRGPMRDRPVSLPDDFIPDLSGNPVLRAIPGPQDDFFGQALETLFASEYLVTAKADRMGYRLQGEPLPIRQGRPQSIVSEPSMPGGIQVPADFQPIVLLVEQTVGGYAKIATVISGDLARMAQATPGDTVRFEKTDLAAAHKIHGDRRAHLARIRDLLA